MSGFVISCNLGNVVYTEPNNFDDALKLLDALEDILKTKRDLVESYILQTRERINMIKAAKGHFKDPVHMDKIHAAIIDVNHYFLSKKETEADMKAFEEKFNLVGFQPDYNTTIALLIKELYVRFQSCKTQNLSSESCSFKIVDDQILVNDKEITTVYKLLNLEKKEQLMKDLYTTLQALER